MAKISQRISLEGGDDIAKKLKELGDAGEKSFKQIADAAAKAKVDPAQFTQTKQAIDGLVITGSQLANQFLQLAQAATRFGTQGTQATAAVTAGLNQTNAAARQTGATMQQVGQQVAAAGQTSGSELISTANKWRLAAVGIVAAVGAIVTALTKGAVETGAKIAEQAEKLKLTTEQWVALRQAIASAGGSFGDFEKGAGKTVDLIGKMKDEIGKVSTTFKVLNEAGKLVDVTATAMSKLTPETAQAVTAFRELGVQMKTLQSGNTLAILTETAAIINRMPDGLKKTAAGVQFFGDHWKETIKALLAAKTATVDSEEAMRKKSRELTTDQVDTAKKVKGAWEDLGAAIRATRDQIGAVFAPGELTRVQWLTQLVDGSRELLKTWLGLSQAGRAAFLENIGDTPVTSAFKILAAVSQQLAGIWNDVLVPAGGKLMGLVARIADSFEGVTKSQVIAFFITATIALAGLAVALKGFGFVLSPISALFSLFVSFGPILIPLIALVVLFWDQLAAGATKVAELIPNSLAAMQDAIRLLFSGDFAGAWANFSAAAVVAFQTISQAAMQQPWVQALVNGFKTIRQQIPGTIELIVQALLALGRAAEVTAAILNRLFGTQLTGTDVAAILIIAQLTGGLQALSSIAIVAGVALSALFGLFGTIAAVAGGAVAAWVALGLVVVAAGVAIFAFRDEIKAGAVAAKDAVIGAFVAMGQAITDLVTTPVGNAWQWLVDSWNEALASIAASWARLKGLLGFGGGGLAADAGIGDIGRFAGGGLLGGRGTGTSDSNLAWVSRGEHIMPARAVSQPGVLAFLEALRRTGGDLRAVMDGMGRFALGGLVAPTLSIPAFASGGAMNAVTIQFPGLPEITGLRASSAVVDELRKAAAMAQVRSGGRKPSRYS
jgi:hypothetical protein